MKLRFLVALAVAGACAIHMVARAAEPLRMEQAVARALASDPSLRAQNAELQAVEARAQREGLGTPYTLGADLENVAGTGSLHGFDSAETTLRIGRVLELGGKRAARQALGAAESNLQQNAVASARVDAASRAAARFVEALVDQQRVEFAGERVNQAASIRSEVQTWVEAGRNPETDLLAAEIAVAQAELDREHAEHELLAARMTLAASWGAVTPDFGELEGDLERLPPIEDFEILAARLRQAPEQQAEGLRAETLAAHRRLASASGKPDVVVSLGIRRLEALNDQGLVMSASMPLGNRSRSSLSVAEADARLAALDARREEALVERQQYLFERYQELNHARIEIEALRSTMLPKAQEALTLARRGFEAGRFSFIALTQSQDRLFELRGKALDAAARYHTLMVEVDRLTTPKESIP